METSFSSHASPTQRSTTATDVQLADAPTSASASASASALAQDRNAAAPSAERPTITINHNGRHVTVPFSTTTATNSRSSQQQQQSQRHVRININNMNNVTGRPNNHNGASVTTRVVQITPLQPQPLPPSNDSTRATTSVENDNPDWERFKCSICYEFMNEPSGCGSCAARFCRTCLELVRQHDRSTNRHGSAASTQSRCPTCRVHYSNVVPDHDLEREILEVGPQLPCRFVGCTDMLRIPHIASHEAVCEHAPVRCRYAPHGCTWTGKRGEVAAHEGATDNRSSGGCALAPIGTLVEQVRHLKVDHGARLDMVAQQMMAVVRSQQQTVALDQIKSISDVISVLHFVYLLTASTPFFVRTRVKWSSYLRNSEQRAAVINILAFLPILLITYITASHSLSNLFALMDVIPSESLYSIIAKSNATESNTDNSFWNQQTEGLVEDFVLGTCAGCLGSLIVVINLLDNRSSTRWQSFRIKHMGNPPLVCDLLAVATFTQVLIVLEYFHAGWKSFLLWCCLTSTTTVFPVLVSGISCHVSRVPSMHGLEARSMHPLLFGLRYGILATYFDIGSCMDAVAVYLLLPRSGRLKAPSVFLMQGSNCFLKDLPDIICAAWLGGRLACCAHAVLPFQLLKKPADLFSVFLLVLQDPMVASCAKATIALLGVNSFFFFLTFCGRQTGRLIALKTDSILATEGPLTGMGALQTDYTAIGLLTFGCWGLTLAMIAHF